LDWVRRHRRATLLVVVVDLAAVALAGPSTGGAASGQPWPPPGDLYGAALALTGYPTPTPVPVQENAEPPVEASPAAVCGPGSRPLAGVQGRVPASALNSPAAASGWTCNLSLVGHHASTGGYKVWRYIDPHGHECAFYDTAIVFPLNVLSLAGPPSTGVVVLDISDPAHPVQTATLTELPMLSPHESVYLNARRGLLAADLGNPGTYPGLMSIYDVSQDCRHPILDSTYPAARFGHESGFSPDGNTFWITGGAQGVAAVDVSDPRHPHTVWEGNVAAHGVSVSDDGNTVYDADASDSTLTILDVSQIQARSPQPVVRMISRLTWNTASLPQSTAPMQIDGHPYLLEFDEFAMRVNPPALGVVGAARIIDIADAANPRVVSNLRLAVNQPAERDADSGDPAGLPGMATGTGYSAHYCAIPREVDPEIVACSFMNSGLRIFNIQDPLHPREVAYYVAPPQAGIINGGQACDLAFSHPAFAPERREVLYTDSVSGFYNLRLDPSAWPAPS
jgi:hypothetical protein